jgi:hypothetical protein
LVVWGTTTREKTMKTKTTDATNCEMYSAGAAHEKIHLAPHYGRFPDATAFYLKVAGVNVRIDRATASAVLEECSRNGTLNGQANGVEVPVVKFHRVNLTCDIG